MGAVDLTGRRFGRLVVLDRAPRPEHASDRRNRRRFWRCACDCGGEHTVCTDNLVRGLTVSCGCRRREAAAATGARTAHGGRGPTGITWHGQTRTAGEWAQRTGLSARLIRLRLQRGWSIDRTLATPARAG